MPTQGAKYNAREEESKRTRKSSSGKAEMKAGSIA